MLMELVWLNIIISELGRSAGPAEMIVATVKTTLVFVVLSKMTQDCYFDVQNVTVKLTCISSQGNSRDEFQKSYGWY